MANEEIVSWPKENIPDQALMFMRVHRNFLDDKGDPTPGVFRNHNKGMSVDWNKYSTPKETLSRARKPAENGIIQMVARNIRQLPSQTVEHSPLEANRAHSEVFGEKDTEVRLKFSRIFKWTIKYKI